MLVSMLVLQTFMNKQRASHQFFIASETGNTDFFPEKVLDNIKA
jgi:hypothetical protein